MIIYNVTVKVEQSIHDAWVDWLIREHIPEVLATGYFRENKVYRILAEDETDGISYSIQYFTDEMSKYFDYISLCAPELRKKGLDKWGDKFVSFRTVLREV